MISGARNRPNPHFPKPAIRPNQVAIGATIAARFVEGSATRLTEIAHRGVLGLDQLATVETAWSEGHFLGPVILDGWKGFSNVCYSI
jgi:hypothetical protein